MKLRRGALQLTSAEAVAWIDDRKVCGAVCYLLCGPAPAAVPGGPGVWGGWQG